MNLEMMKVGEELANLKPNIKKIFFYRICGTGMGACACMAKEAGYDITGADLSYSPPMSTYLESQNIPLLDLKELTKEQMQEFDLIVVGNSVPRQSEFASFIEECGVPFTSFPSFLGEFILKEKEVIGICGTHGKTTTTYFLAQMLESLGENCGYFIGGIIDGRAPSRFGESKYFVIESDEYDSAYFQKISKFRLYELNHMILTSLEFDHADIFNSIEDIKDEFRAILPELPGKLIVNDDYSAALELVQEFPSKPWTVYGEKSDAGPKNISIVDGKSNFTVEIEDQNIDFQTNIIGTHNLLNITSCIIVLSKLGFSTEKIQAAVSELGMVKRRQEERGYYKGALVIDDFAHHPKAITLTLEAIKAKYPGKKLVTIFEPVSATARSAIFQNEFTLSLETSDEVILAQNPMHTTVKDAKDLDCDLIVKNLNEKNIDAYKAQNLDELREKIDQKANDQTLLVVLSNRTCIGLWESDFVKELR